MQRGENGIPMTAWYGMVWHGMAWHGMAVDPLWVLILYRRHYGDKTRLTDDSNDLSIVPSDALELRPFPLPGTSWTPRRAALWAVAAMLVAGSPARLLVPPVDC